MASVCPHCSLLQTRPSTLNQHVLTFAPSHAALLAELAALELVAADLPERERALESMCDEVATEQSRIAKGRETLRDNWRIEHAGAPPKSPNANSTFGGLLKKESSHSRLKLAHDYTIYMDAVENWNLAEVQLEEKRQLVILAAKTVSELRDQLEPLERFNQKLDRLYSAVFEGCMSEAPELQLFEWEVKCAKQESENIIDALSSERKGLKLLDTAHATHSSILRHFAKVEQLALELPQWAEHAGTAKNAEYLVLGSTLGMIERLQLKAANQIKLVSEHKFGHANPRVVSIPAADILPMSPITGGVVVPPVVTIEGETVHPRKPRPSRESSADEVMEMLLASVASVRRAVAALDLERESAKRRIDRYTADMSQLRDTLNGEKLRRRMMCRAIFERVASTSGASTPSLVVAASLLPGDLGSPDNGGAEVPPAYSGRTTNT